MKILDANLLLYAFDTECPQYLMASRWLEEAIQGPELIGLPWVSIWAFFRVSTNQRLWQRPKTIVEAWEAMEELVAAPGVVVIEPGRRHLAILRSLTEKHQSTGSKMTDAVLAALAVENNAVLVSTDQGFGRFRGLRWSDPLAKLDPVDEGSVR